MKTSEHQLDGVFAGFFCRASKGMAYITALQRRLCKMLDKTEQFNNFEKRGENGVRGEIASGHFSEEKERSALEWLRQKAQERAAKAAKTRSAIAIAVSTAALILSIL